MNGRVLSLAEIAALTGASLTEGAARADRRTIGRVDAIAMADGSALVFAEDESTLRSALASSAGAILARETLFASGDDRVLRLRDPRYGFAACARELARESHADARPVVHASAVVDPSVSLGARVRVAAGVIVGSGAVVGEDCLLGPGVVVHEGVMLGKRVVVQAGAVLGSQGFGYVRHRDTGEYLLFPQQGSLVIEDDVEIGANTTIDRGALEETRIGRGTKIDNLVHIGHNCRVGKNVIIAAQVGVSGSCVIEDGAVLAGQVGISDHCHIGPGVILGGQAGLYRGKHITGAGELFAGTPAEPWRDHMRALARLRRIR